MKNIYKIFLVSIGLLQLPALAQASGFLHCQWAPFGGNYDYFPLPIFDNTGYDEEKGTQSDRYRLEGEEKVACGVASVKPKDLKADYEKAKGFCFGYVTCDLNPKPFVVNCPRRGGCSEGSAGATSCANGVSKANEPVRPLNSGGFGAGKGR